MAGHSKWANIRHRKERMDSKRGKVFARLIKETAVAAKIGGADPANNSRLRLALEKARAANVPGDNLERAVKRGGGQLEGVQYAEIRYEGYGPGGCAIIVDCLTDNKNRALSEIRNAFHKNGGNLGAGSVERLFSRCGQLFYAPGADETALVEIAAENGASDWYTGEDGSVEILCAAADFAGLAEAMRAAGHPPAEADIVMRPSAETPLTGEDAQKTERLIRILEDLEDAQHVYTNAVWEEIS